MLKSKAIRWIASHGQIIKKLVGTNLALAMLAGGILPTSFVSPLDLSLNLPQKTLFQEVTGSEVVPAETQIKTETGIQLPITGYIITQGFFPWHPAVDLSIKVGTPVKPIMVGTVEKVDHSKFDYGNSIIINHGSGITSLYAHLSKTLVKEGDKVTLDTILGLSGSTGNSTGPHLHLEIRQDEKPINPFSLLSLIPKKVIANQQ
jgi:murein DD-endopeptidase MepM/ murein hydrolase activator NlpD